MKKTSIVLPIFLGALIAVGPAVASANHSETSAGVEAQASVHVESDGHPSETGKGLLNRLVDKEHDDRARADAKAGMQLKERMGTTTKGDRDERVKENAGKMQDKSAQMIDARIKNLQAQITRIGKMERLSDAQKTSITAELQAQITSLTDLKAKIGTETASTTLKDYLHSITQAYRVYAVTMPKAAIIAASDRIMTVVAQMETFGTKVSARIETAATAGVDVTSARAAYTDFTAKIADAKVQAQAAATLVASLSADNGDTATQASNATAIKAARADLETAHADLKAARKDIDTILKAVKGTGEVKVKAEASTGN